MARDRRTCRRKRGHATRESFAQAQDPARGTLPGTGLIASTARDHQYWSELTTSPPLRVESCWYTPNLVPAAKMKPPWASRLTPIGKPFPPELGTGFMLTVVVLLDWI